MEKNKCRHRRTWFIGSEEARYEWCWVCGALRKHGNIKIKYGKMRLVTEYLKPCSRWLRPTGDGGDNPGHFKFLGAKDLIGRIKSIPEGKKGR